MSFLDSKLILRVRDKEVKLIDAAIALSPGLYDSRSHFGRVALLRELRRALPGKCEDLDNGFKR